MSNRPFGSFNKTIVNSSDYIAKKRQVAVYRNAARPASGFGIAEGEDEGGDKVDKVVFTARNHEDLLTLTKGMYHCARDNSGAYTLKYDIWSGNKMVMNYDENPVTHTENIDEDDNVGYIVDMSGTLFGTGELGDGPAWVDNTTVTADNSDYERGNKSQPLHNFHYPGRGACRTLKN